MKDSVFMFRRKSTVEDDSSDDMRIAVEPGAIIINDQCYLLENLTSTVIEGTQIDMEDSVNEIVRKIKKDEFKKRLYNFGFAALCLATLLIPDRLFYCDFLRHIDGASMESDIAFLHGLLSVFFSVRFLKRALAKKKEIKIDDDAYVADIATLFMVFDYDPEHMITFSSNRTTINALLDDIQKNRSLEPCLEEKADV